MSTHDGRTPPVQARPGDEERIAGYTTKDAAEKLGVTPVGLSMVRRHFTAYTTQQAHRATYWNRQLVDSAYEIKARQRLGLRRSLEEAAKEVPPKGDRK